MKNYQVELLFCWCQESGSRVVFGKNKHSKPPPEKEKQKKSIRKRRWFGVQ